MIETLLLVALGFVAASLLSLLIAPAAWRRAVRLTTARLEATMPISVADINADKDHIRAESAVEQRRLELELEKARDRAARHLMERNMHNVEIGKLKTQIAELETTRTERSKAKLVLEQTVKKRIPELEAQIEDLNQIIVTRDKELADRARAFANQGETLTLSQSITRRQEQEMETLRSSLEAGVGSQLKKFGRKVDMDEKYDELAREKGKADAELSRLRQEMAQLQEVEIADAAELRREMQHLTALMLSGTPAAKPEETDPEPVARKAKASKTPTAKKEKKSDPEPKRKKPWRRKKQPPKSRKNLTERISQLTANKQKADA